MVYQFATLQNIVGNFVEKWNAYNVLCEVENDNIVSTYKLNLLLLYI